MMTEGATRAGETVQTERMKELSFSQAGLFLLLLFPGLVSVTVYRLIMPARELKWNDASLAALFYGAINFVLTLPFLLWLLQDHEETANSENRSPDHAVFS